jgi:hypothetical protein
MAMDIVHSESGEDGEQSTHFSNKGPLAFSFNVFFLRRRPREMIEAVRSMQIRFSLLICSGCSFRESCGWCDILKLF